MFVGRDRELKYLNTMYESKKAEMVVLYGRRRIGKTELIRQFIQDKRYVFYSAIEVDDREQLRRFSQVIMEARGDDMTLDGYHSWDDLFSGLKTIQSDDKLIMVIDEFPYLIGSNKAIPSIMQNLWDHELKELNLMIILSGSSIGLMYDEILGGNNPLYGRISGSYRLEELSYRTTSAFFPTYSHKDRIIAYCILGGVPEYLKTFDSSLSLEENIIRYILTKGSRLYDEVNLLMKQELREPGTYYTILEAVAMGKTKLNEIHQYTLIEKTKIVTYLKKLIHLGIVIREHPITEKQKKKVNVQTGLYKVKNNLFRFYFRYILPNFSLLELGGENLVYKSTVTTSLNDFVSKGYENICIDYMMQMNLKGKLPLLLTNLGSYWHKGIEIDVVGFNKKGTILGECKWRNERLSIKVLKRLEAKGQGLFGNNVVAGMYLFSMSGFTEELKEVEQQRQDVTLINPEDLFSI